MRFEDLNWFDVEEYLKKDNRLILVLGSCEQHGYLSLLTDAKIPMALADAASQQTKVLVAPPVSFGISPYFLAYPGTLSLRVSTLLDIAEDLVSSAYQQGFCRILVINGHGGNDPVRLRLHELANGYPDLRMVWYDWWKSHSVEEVAIRHNLKPSHGNWLEAFSFTQVADLPSGEKVPPRVPGVMGSAKARQVYGDGVFGGRYAATESVMNEIFTAALQDILMLLQFE